MKSTAASTKPTGLLSLSKQVVHDPSAPGQAQAIVDGTASPHPPVRADHGGPTAERVRRPTALSILSASLPQFGLPANVNRWRLRNFWRLLGPALRVAIYNRFTGPYALSYLYLTKISQPAGAQLIVTHYGLASCKSVTTAGVNFLVDALQGTVEPEILRFHGYGTGTNAESVADTALQTEETTQYNPDNTRPTGSLGEGAAANVFRTVATYSPDSGGTRAITEHGIFSQSATGGGTLLDRSVFAAVNLVAGADSLQTTYDLTIASGG